MYRAPSKADSGPSFEPSPTARSVASSDPRNVADQPSNSNSLHTLNLADDFEVQLPALFLTETSAISITYQLLVKPIITRKHRQSRSLSGYQPAVYPG